MISDPPTFVLIGLGRHRTKRGEQVNGHKVKKRQVRRTLALVDHADLTVWNSIRACSSIHASILSCHIRRRSNDRRR